MGFGTPPVEVTNPWDDYFYWLTLFETIDGFGQDGTFTHFDAYLKMAVGGNSSGYLYKNPENVSVLGTWDKKRKMRVFFRLIYATNQIIRFLVGYDGGKLIGFRIEEATLYGIVHDGVSESSLELATLSVDTDYIVEAVFEPDVECRFYLDGVDKGVLTTNLPSGADENYCIMDVDLVATTVVARDFWLRMYEFWQER